MLQHDIMFIPYQHFQWRITLLAYEVVVDETAVVAKAVKDEVALEKVAFAIV